MGHHAPPLIVPDLRTPGQSMATLSVKVPPAVVTDLRTAADRCSVSPSAIARTLLVNGLQRLNATAGEVA